MSALLSLSGGALPAAPHGPHLRRSLRQSAALVNHPGIKYSVSRILVPAATRIRPRALPEEGAEADAPEAGPGSSAEGAPAKPEAGAGSPPATAASNNNKATGATGEAFPATPAAQRTQDRTVVLGLTAALTLLVTAAFTVGRDAIDDIMYNVVMGSLDSSFGAGDIAAGLMWSVSLYFVSPIQLLLLFLGKIETERPSDEVLDILGRLTGQDVDAVDYSAPVYLKAAVAASSVVSGFALAWIFEAGLGDSTWGVAGGIGSLMAAGVYEVGRPKRLDPEEALRLESQWQDFARFADERLQRSGRCHESEINKAFRRSFAKYRDPSVVPDDILRDMVRNWAPGVSRTASGYYKGISLIPRADPFQ